MPFWTAYTAFNDIFVNSRGEQFPKAWKSSPSSNTEWFSLPMLAPQGGTSRAQAGLGSTALTIFWQPISASWLPLCTHLTRCRQLRDAELQVSSWRPSVHPKALDWFYCQVTLMIGKHCMWYSFLSACLQEREEETLVLSTHLCLQDPFSVAVRLVGGAV